MRPPKARRIVIAVYEGVSLLDLAGPLEARGPIQYALDTDWLAEDAVRSETVSRGRVSLQFAIYSEVFKNCRDSRFYCVKFSIAFNALEAPSRSKGAGRRFGYCREKFGYCSERFGWCREKFAGHVWGTNQRKCIALKAHGSFAGINREWLAGFAGAQVLIAKGHNSTLPSLVRTVLRAHLPSCPFDRGVSEFDLR
jgi:hypothetical protein